MTPIELTDVWWRMHSYLVTGGAGFIGSHLVDALLAAGEHVVVLDDLSAGKLANLAHHSKDPHFEFIQGSVLDATLVSQIVDRVDGIYHLAAVVGVKYVIEDPLRGMRVNIGGTETVLESAHTRRRPVLVASSSEVYGKSASLPFCEDQDTVLGPTSVPRWSYALSKMLDEHLAFAYQRQKGLPTVAVRYFNAYGPRLDARGYGSVIARFIVQALKGEPLTIYGDGSQTRALTYVTDTVRGTIAAMSTIAAAGSPAVAGRCFNIGCERETSIAELAQRVRAIAEADVPIVHVPFSAVYGANYEETQHRRPAVELAADSLGFRAQVALEDGLRRTVQWFKEHRDEYIAA